MVENEHIENPEFSEEPEWDNNKKNNRIYETSDQSQNIESLKASISDFTTSLKLNIESINFDYKDSPIGKELNKIIGAIDELNIPDNINSEENDALEEEYR